MKTKMPKTLVVLSSLILSSFVSHAAHATPYTESMKKVSAALAGIRAIEGSNPNRFGPIASINVLRNGEFRVITQNCTFRVVVEKNASNRTQARVIDDGSICLL